MYFLVPPSSSSSLGSLSSSRLLLFWFIYWYGLQQSNGLVPSYRWICPSNQVDQTRLVVAFGVPTSIQTNLVLRYESYRFQFRTFSHGRKYETKVSRIPCRDVCTERNIGKQKNSKKGIGTILKLANNAIGMLQTNNETEFLQCHTKINDSKSLVIPTHRLKKKVYGCHHPYSSAIQALRVYHELHGDLAIPRRYVIPYPEQNETSLRYPLEWHGVDLASSVYNMEWWQKHVKQRPERVTALNELGFVWSRLQPEWNIILEALVAYHTLYGNVMVPQNFVVPHGDTHWPVACWGIHLGSVVYRIRTRFDFFRGPQAADRRKQLDGLGFVWDVRDFKFRIFYQALRHYAIHSNVGLYSLTERTQPLIVPSTFVVPSNDDSWPKHLWKFPLGAKCVAIRQKGLYVKGDVSRQKALEDLGFHWGGNSMFGWLEVVHAAAIYSRLNNRHLDVPCHFVVPQPPPLSSHNTYPEEWPWPAHLWGLPLGERLKDVRVKNTYLKGTDQLSRRRQLDALGFVWKPKRGRRSKQPTTLTSSNTK